MIIVLFGFQSLMMPQIYMAVYVPFVFVSSWMIGRWGLRHGLLLGAFLNAVGAGARACYAHSQYKYHQVRYAGASQLWLLMLGQGIAAVAQTFILGAKTPPIRAFDSRVSTGVPSRVAAVWFGAHERSMATSLGARFKHVMRVR